YSPCIHALVLSSTASSFFFFFNDAATPEISTLSLHDALPIFAPLEQHRPGDERRGRQPRERLDQFRLTVAFDTRDTDDFEGNGRSEEHTSELQSLTNLVCRLLLEKKKIMTRSHA